MKTTNYIVIPGWAITNLKLSGNELVLYSIIHGFSQDGVSEFTGTQSYLSEAVGATDRTVRNILCGLCDRGLLVKREFVRDGKHMCAYKTVVPEMGAAPIEVVEVKKEPKPKKEFVPPTVDEVREYAKENGLTLDAEVFVGYYTKTGWRDLGGKPVLNWKNRAISWSYREAHHMNGGRIPGAIKYVESLSESELKERYGIK